MIQKIKNRLSWGAILFSVLGLSGCAQHMVNSNVTKNTVPTMIAHTQKVQAVGHGAVGMSTNTSPAQAKLMAMRAARVDAYRSLAELVYGYKMNGGTTVSSFATQSDQVRVYVDTFIRGTRLVSVMANNEGNYEALVELDLPVNFFDCISGWVNSSVSCRESLSHQTSWSRENCGFYGCSVSSANNLVSP